MFCISTLAAAALGNSLSNGKSNNNMNGQKVMIAMIMIMTQRCLSAHSVVHTMHIFSSHCRTYFAFTLRVHAVTPLEFAGLGMVLHGAVERFANRLGLPDPRLTAYQRGTEVVKNVRMGASIVGVLLGCILGMFPLLFLNAPPSERQHSIKGEASSSL